MLLSFPCNQRSDEAACLRKCYLHNFVMFEKLRAYCSQRATFTEEEFALMESLFIPKRLHKRDFLLREGEVSKYGAFVVKGCLRSYSVDNKGREHILQFSPEEWWTGNMESYKSGMPSKYFIDAIETTDVLLQDASGFEKVMEAVPTFASMFHSGIQKSSSVKDERIIAALSSTAEERYLSFLERYPTIAQRVPQHMLASYLGISPETLSRVRKQITKKR